MNHDHEPVERTIEMVQNQIRNLENDLAEKRRMVNSLCRLIGREAIYNNVEPSQVGTVLRSDEFYGKSLTSAARTVLERRDAAGLGAVSVDVLYADLVRGGFQFDAKNDGTAKRSLAISLAKNSYLFHRLPNGDWGLVGWYDRLPSKSKVPVNKDVKDEKEDRASLDQPYPNEFADDKSSEESNGETSDSLEPELAGSEQPNQPPGQRVRRHRDSTIAEQLRNL